MSTNATARRVTLLFLFLATWLAGAAAPAAALVPDPGPDGTVGAAGEAGSSAFEPGLWVLIGVAAALIAAGSLAVALFRRRGARTAALASS